MTSFLRKRPITFSDDDDDDENVQALLNTPSKRRSGNVQALYNEKLKLALPPPDFQSLLARANAAKDENRSRTSVGKEDIKGEAEEAIVTPPMTPTRRSTRQTSKFDLSENSPPSSSFPSTPKRKGLLTPKSPSAASVQNSLNNCNNTTGLTPIINRMMKYPKENAPRKSIRDKENPEAKGYSTPKRLVRTKSNIEPKQSETLAAKPTETSPTATTALGFYQEAKTLFRRTTEPRRLIGRASEREAVRLFCQNHILTTKAGSLYISGQPGTGKTALLKEIMRDMEDELLNAEHEIKVININCMTIQDPKLVYEKLLEGMDHVAESKDKETVIKSVGSLVLESNKKKIMYVTILDEIDQLLTKDQEVLYKLFEWSSLENSKLTLIGIANALDMTDRFLPRLKAKNCEPQLLNFNPYQVSEISAIIKDRLFSLEGVPKEIEDKEKVDSRLRIAPLMQRPAIELCARKVAAATGDLRKALDICRQTFEMVEMEARRKEKAVKTMTVIPVNGVMPLQEIRLSELENRPVGSRRLSLGRSLSAPLVPTTSVVAPGASLGEITIQDAPRVTVEHMKKALASAFGSPMVQKIRALNVHQKIVLAVLVMKIQTGKTIDCMVGKVFDHYTAVCRGSNKIGAVNRGEYQDLINMLEANGIINLGKAKEERLRKIDMVPQEHEVLDAIKGLDIIDTILSKEGVKMPTP